MEDRTDTGEDIRETRILTDAEVELLVEQVMYSLWAEFLEHNERVAANVGEKVRIISLGLRCSGAREALGMTLKMAAASMKCPQYQLKFIERGHVSEIRSKLLQRYVEFLEIGPWVTTWVAKNRELAVKLGLDDYLGDV